MKYFSFFIVCLWSVGAFSQQGQIRDLDAINLIVYGNKVSASIAYPSDAHRHNVKADCLVMDIKFDKKVKLAKMLRTKLALASKIKVTDFGYTLKPRIRGQRVIYELKTGGWYITIIEAISKSPSGLTADILSLGTPDNMIKEAELTYVRNCRKL